MSGLLMEELQFITGLDPVADAFDSTVVSDVIDMSAFSRIVFLVHVGVGATGTSTYTVEACDDIVPTTQSAIPFYTRSDHSGDEGAITLNASTGYLSIAGSSKILAFEVREDALAAIGYRYVRLKAVESVNSPVLAGIMVVGKAKNPSQAKNSAID